MFAVDGCILKNLFTIRSIILLRSGTPPAVELGSWCVGSTATELGEDLVGDIFLETTRFVIIRK